METPAKPVESNQQTIILERALSVWRKAQVLHEGPSWKGHPEARAIAEEIAAAHPECEESLASLLADKCQFVAGYALLTLELMRSRIIEDLPDEILQRRSNVSVVYEGIRSATDLGGLARQIRKRARGNASEQSITSD
jgi:hypothetical protein